MRVLIPTMTRPHLGGAYTLLSATGKGLVRRGHQVTFVSLFSPLMGAATPPLALDAVRKSDRFLSGARGDRPRDLRTRAVYVAARAALAARIALVLARHPHDVAFTIDAGATQALHMQRRWRALGSVFDVAGRLLLDLEGQGKITRGGAAARWFLKEERASYRHATVVWAYPPSFAAELAMIEPSARIETASTAILDLDHIKPVHDITERRRARASFGIPGDIDAEPIILFPSRLVARKGAVIAASALAHLKQIAPPSRARGARLVMAGDGPETAAVQEIARAAGVADRLHMLGGVAPPRMGDAYAMADVVILPAVPAHGYEEPQGLTTFEALAAERPVIASALGGLTEVIFDGRTGLLTPPGDAPTLAHAIARILDAPSLASTLVAGGRAELDHRLANDRHFVLLEALLDQARAMQHAPRTR